MNNSKHSPQNLQLFMKHVQGSDSRSDLKQHTNHHKPPRPKNLSTRNTTSQKLRDTINQESKTVKNHKNYKNYIIFLNIQSSALRFAKGNVVNAVGSTRTGCRVGLTTNHF